MPRRVGQNRAAPVPAAGVKFNHFFNCAERTIVQVRAAEGEVAQGGRFDRAIHHITESGVERPAGFHGETADVHGDGIDGCAAAELARERERIAPRICAAEPKFHASGPHADVVEAEVVAARIAVAGSHTVDRTALRGA
ncbi:MAG: hypothetical protein FJW31_28380 [Acidobacteria bacterium]|nr:hypothetical protein [Acidobacteriota bacterium]